VSGLFVPDRAERDDLGSFTARVVRLDQGAFVRLRAEHDRVVAWAQTPFDVLATRSARGTMSPSDITVLGSHLLAGLAVARAERIDPGTPADAHWRSALPPDDGWRYIADVSADDLDGPVGRELDETAFTARDAAGRDAVRVPHRCVLSLAGLGLLDDTDRVRVFATPTWLRLDARCGAAVRRRQAVLPLVGLN
jgi:hypothetical protein